MITKAKIQIVSNPSWLYGKKHVVMASDYEKLWEAYQQQEQELIKARAETAEWEKSARMAIAKGIRQR